MYCGLITVAITLLLPQRQQRHKRPSSILRRILKLRGEQNSNLMVNCAKQSRIPGNPGRCFSSVRMCLMFPVNISGLVIEGETTHAHLRRNKQACVNWRVVGLEFRKGCWFHDYDWSISSCKYLSHHPCVRFTFAVRCQCFSPRALNTKLNMLIIVVSNA